MFYVKYGDKYLVQFYDKWDDRFKCIRMTVNSVHKFPTTSLSWHVLIKKRIESKNDTHLKEKTKSKEFAWLHAHNTFVVVPQF